jgi:6-phosphogluconolactonase
LSLHVEVVADMASIARKSLDLMQGTRIAVSGGSTYATLFPLWLEHVATRVKAGEPMRFYPVDERMVAYDEGGCNWKVCVDSLLDPAGLGKQKAHHVTTLSGFAALLQKDLTPDGRFDTVYLGMGNDGHTASLFPGEDHLLDTSSQVLQTVSPKPPFPRLTLGLKALSQAKHLVAIINGKDKAEMAQRLLQGDKSLPITLALQGHPSPVLILDAAAAGKV